ncbi:MAG: DNA-3-methyladenine glycosylase [Bacteroidetes bacterium]|nr:DNA-3-methyladenine glycosylase [Bacteroidota bacterium]
MTHVKHLSKDKLLKKAIAKSGRIELKKRKNIFIHLIKSITSQQLSTKVAEVIYNRFLDLFGVEPTPEQVLELKHEQLRAIGLSNSKVTYVQNVARFAIEKGLDLKRLNKMNNEELIDYLTEIKGVGRWTAEMIMMFALGREDVFAVDDLGIQMAIKNLYQLKINETPKLKKKMLVISESWSPYRTYACMYLWRWRD